MITKSDVLRVANELHQKGIVPTNALIRKTLGGGSYATINKAMKEWRAELRQEQEDGLRKLKVELEQIIDIPAMVQTIQAHSCQKAEDMIRLAQRQAEEIEQELQAAALRASDLEAELVQARQENLDQQARFADQQKQIAMLEERLDNMATKERALVHRIDKAIEANAKAERSLMACEEGKKILADQVDRQREELEMADEKAKDTENIFGRFLKRMNQAARLVDRLKYETPRNDQRKEALERVVLEAEALVDRCYVGGLPKPKN